MADQQPGPITKALLKGDLLKFKPLPKIEYPGMADPAPLQQPQIEVYHAKGTGWEVTAYVPEKVTVWAGLTSNVGNLHILIQNLQLASDAIKFHKKPNVVMAHTQESEYWAKATNSPLPLETLQAKQDLMNQVTNWALDMAMAQAKPDMTFSLKGVQDDSHLPGAPKEDDY